MNNFIYIKIKRFCSILVLLLAFALGQEAKGQVVYSLSSTGALDGYNTGTATNANLASISPAFTGGTTSFTGFGNYLYAMDKVTTATPLWRYDPVANTWTALNNLSSANAFGALFTDGTSLYIKKASEGAGGTISKYNPTTDTWAASTVMTGSYFQAFSGVGAAYVVASGGTAWVVSKYNPTTNTLSVLTTAPAFAAGAWAADANNIYFLLTGVTPSFHIYNLASNTWSTGTTSPAPRDIVSDGTNVYMHGLNKEFYKYDFTSNTWTLLFTSAINTGAMTMAGSFWTLPTCAVPAATVSVTPPTCTGSTANANGTITLSAMDANAKKVDFSMGSTYTGAGFASAQTISGSSFVVTSTIPNPAVSQDYTVRIFCDATTYFDKTITIIPNSCLSYTYSVDGGPFQSSNIFSCVLPGTHSVVVKDNTGCSSPPTTITINPPSGVPALTATMVNPTCALPNSGSITVTAPTGATYTYNIDGGPYQASTIFSGLAAGPHTIVAKNSTDGCLSAQEFILTKGGITPPVITVTPPSCSNANTVVTVTSPAAGAGITYALYNWHDNTYGVYQAATTFSVPYNATNSYDFSVSVDNNGCTALGTTHIYPTDQPKTPLTPTASVVQPTCTVSTGTITVALNAAETINGTTIYYSIDGTNFQVSNIFANLAPGNYQIWLKNNVGACTTAPISVTINAVPLVPLVPIATTTQPDCATPTGTITVSSPTGADIAYSINGTDYSNTTGLFTSVASGTYSVTAKNTTSGCVSAATSAVINTTPITPTIPTATAVQPTCLVGTGSITVTAPTGADIAYSIDGATYQAGTIFASLATGTYSVTAKNNTSGCISEGFELIIDPQPTAPDTPTATVSNPTCSVATGTITVTEPMGAGLTYSINGTDYSNTTGEFTGVATGTYAVTVKNTAGCVSPALNVTINAQPTTPVTPIASVTQPVCPSTTGSITVTSPMGAGLVYNLDGTQFFSSNTTGLFTGVIGGTYALNVMNPNGNCASPNLTVTVNTPPCAGFDLALKKTLHPSQSPTVAAGETVYFVINVINQGNAKATNVQITDYIPAGLTLNDPNWTSPVGGKTTLVTPISAIEIGETIPLIITFTADVFNGVVTNFAEISAATGGTDVDSTPDNDPSNDGTVQDDVITGIRKTNPNDDEDDHDPASVTISGSGIFDLALKKTLAAGQSSSVVAGGTAKFTISVINQGTLGATNVQVTDYIPTGLTLNDANWTLAGNKASLATPIATLAAGATVTRDITFTVDASSTGTITNFAEISAATGGTDIDSTPDADNANDGTVKNDIITENGKTGGDEDDHDPEPITVTATPVCAISLTATAGNCTVATNQYAVTGNLTFSNAPSTGTLTVSMGAATQVFNAPFTTGQAYTLSGLTADGASHTVTAIFSADANCTNTMTYTAPASCAVNCVPPNAGADFTMCLPKTTTNLSDAGIGYEWVVVTGNPTAAVINATSGVITGMTSVGTYKFRLQKTGDATCSDEMQVIVTAGDAVIALCNNGLSTYTLIAQAGLTNVIWYNMAGVQVGTGATLVVKSTTLGLEDGTEAYYFVGQNGAASGCDVELCCPVKFITQTCCPTPNCLTVSVIKN